MFSKKGEKYQFSAIKKLLWVLVIILLFLTVAASYTYSKVKRAQDSYQKTAVAYHTEERKVPSEEVVKSSKPISFLLLGVDEREQDQGRSDTMMVVTLNPKKHSAKLVSIPRDSYVEIAEKEKFDKINHAYAYNGIEGASKTVERLFNIPIDYVIKLNMQGVVDLVDLMGGVTIDNPMAFTSHGQEFKKGEITLDGDDALEYMRMRKSDPEGDFGRQNRQRIVLAGLAQQLKSAETIKKFDNLLTVMKYNMQTNVPMNQLNTLRKEYLNNVDKTEQLPLDKGKDTKKRGIYYYKLNTQQLEHTTDALRKHLELHDNE